jgi:hypothetical protein
MSYRTAAGEHESLSATKTTIAAMQREMIRGLKLLLISTPGI